jgi:hypothetical protein
VLGVDLTSSHLISLRLTMLPKCRPTLSGRIRRLAPLTALIKCLLSPPLGRLACPLAALGSTPISTRTLRQLSDNLPSQERCCAGIACDARMYTWRAF